MALRLLSTLASTFSLACSFPSVSYVVDADAADATTKDSSVADAQDGGATPDADPCDRDHDQYLAMTCEGGNDCDDNDDRAHPGADFSTAPPTPTTNGDWNCDKIVEKQYKAINCGGLSSNCASAAGFAMDEGCGITGAYVQCAGVAICSATDAGSRTQGCR
jgi:hypothetical protein